MTSKQAANSQCSFFFLLLAAKLEVLFIYMAVIQQESWGKSITFFLLWLSSCPARPSAVQLGVMQQRYVAKQACRATDQPCTTLIPTSTNHVHNHSTLNLPVTREYLLRQMRLLVYNTNMSTYTHTHIHTQLLWYVRQSKSYHKY